MIESDSAPHAAGVVVVREHQLHLRVALVRLQVCAGAADLPLQVAREAVLLHLARPKLHLRIDSSLKLLIALQHGETRRGAQGYITQ